MELSVALQFFLIKNILYYTRGLKDVLLSRENIFGIKGIDWPSFVNSKTYTNLIANVKLDETKWSTQFKDHYEKINSLPNQAYFTNIKKYINEEIESYGAIEHYHSKIPDSIKLPLRAVLMMSYKAIRKSLDDKLLHKIRFVKLEKDIYSRILVRLILCAAWNRIYNVSNSQPDIQLLPKISIFKNQTS